MAVMARVGGGGTATPPRTRPQAPNGVDAANAGAQVAAPCWRHRPGARTSSPGDRPSKHQTETTRAFETAVEQFNPPALRVDSSTTTRDTHTRRPNRRTRRAAALCPSAPLRRPPIARTRRPRRPDERSRRQNDSACKAPGPSDSRASATAAAASRQRARQTRPPREAPSEADVDSNPGWTRFCAPHAARASAPRSLVNDDCTPAIRPRPR
ncbi:hypothetical protein P154DRAFT_577394 [Amniculicola lignicola CBS 123094]|uniref:Uncharacterized protein n=1 Tax=Amniculicola lignicola CBS 123094 TaxID=1392246 RepID=A0A6A5WIP1_9PLEO|nr:hypothetical protein P154DRAFT_577394 [Amniculicola lignicola CBS 123094]